MSHLKRFKLNTWKPKFCAISIFFPCNGVFRITIFSQAHYFQRLSLQTTRSLIIWELITLRKLIAYTKLLSLVTITSMWLLLVESELHSLMCAQCVMISQSVKKQNVGQLFFACFDAANQFHPLLESWQKNPLTTLYHPPT